MSKLALVTGSSRGIGKATAITLAKDGFDIVVHYINNKQKAEEVIKEIKKLDRRAYLVQGDVSTEKDVKRVFSEISKFTDVLDVLVNNAGFDYGYMIEDYTLDQMKKVIDITMFGKIAMTKYALPFLKKSKYPSIVNIASRMGGPTTIPTVGAYAPAEAGVIKFTQCCALEFAKYKIRVNCVAPGLTDTDMTRGIYPKESFWKAKAESNPRGRVGRPQDHANVISFLVSEKADYITGDTILITGGSNLC